MKSSGEFDLLLECVRRRITGAIQEPVDPAPLSLIDWKRFLKMTQRHRLVPHVFAALSPDALMSVPDSVVRKLKAMQQSIVMKNCRLAAELRKIVEVFGQAEIAVRPFKGPTLAVEAYGGLEGRQFNDLDLMIRPTDLTAALCLFRDQGYQPELTGIDQLTERRTQQLTARNNELRLYRSTANIAIKIDLHWRYSSAPCFFETPHDQLFSGDNSCQMGGCKISTIPMNQQIVYLAYHGCKHQCMRLSWLCDFSVAMNQIARSDWPTFLGELNSNNRRMVICALLMLEKLSLINSLDSEIPCVDVWRRRLRPVINQMCEVTMAEDAVPLLGTFSTGLWRWRVSGRVRPFAHTILQSFLPAEQDLLQPGFAGPWLSRLNSVVQKVTSRSADVESTSTSLEAAGA